ncbi:hypothetical protein SCARR_03945 [Pontiella sulfatireligans]|uniref:Uncharacterized protein n=1 Tax=Pontiella sulfatireligans TaxID=2750658 RepID=A0A6C2UNM8_9BACT|nr:hypothetical protein SCARR_03945 [Pontiella sulfatireligans]
MAAQLRINCALNEHKDLTQQSWNQVVMDRKMEGRNISSTACSIHFSATNFSAHTIC